MIAKRYRFDPTTGEVNEEEIISKPDPEAARRERAAEERDTKLGHYPGGQYL